MQATPALSLYIDRGNYRQDLTDDDYHSYNNTNVNPFLPPGFRRVGDQQQQGSSVDNTCSTSSSLIDRDALMSSIDAYSAFVNSTRSDGVALKEVISYNDLDEVNANLISESEQSSSISSTSSITSKTPNAIEPSQSKPSQKFKSPIQLMKLVPKVEPQVASVFFVKPAIDTDTTDVKDMPSPTSSSNTDSNANKSFNKWQPPNQSNQRKKWSSTAFKAGNYLESLSSPSSSRTDNPSSNTINNDEEDEDDTKSLLQSLRAQQAQLRMERQKLQQRAMQDAIQRTNPKEAIMARLEKTEEERKRKEREKLEKAYMERKERLDAKIKEEREKRESRIRYVEGRRRQADLLREKEMERSNTGSIGKRGIPILGPFIGKDLSSPLLVGSTFTLQYSTLTPYQLKALEVAQCYHTEHCSNMELEGQLSGAGDDAGTAELCMITSGEDGGIEAAPIVAIIDNHTASASSPLLEKKGKQVHKRYATLASVQLVYSEGSSEPAAVKLFGVGRVFLHGYFSSKDAGLSKEEEELANLLEMIQKYNNAEKDVEEVEEHGDEDVESCDDIPAVLAEFTMFMDDSSILSKSTKHDVSKQRASNRHAVTELYRNANKVYRLHEERKKLLSGLRTGQARLNLRETMDNEMIEYDDWSDLSFIDEGEDAETLLEHTEDYGFSSFGILSTIPDLTKEVLVRLEPYYSPAHREREEYEAEVASFVVFKSLEKYASPSDMALALLAPSATERFQMAYDIMMRHREELMTLVEKMSDDLRECGEECTDLW